MFNKIPLNTFYLIKNFKEDLYKFLSVSCILLFLVFSDSYSQTTVVPVRYWTFNGASATTDSTNHAPLDFSYYGCQYTIANSKVGKCINLNATGNLVVGSAINADSSFTIEFLFKPSALFNNTKFFNRADNAISIGFSYPYIDFNTKHTTYAGSAISDNWRITLDGVNRKSYGYYTDGNWHHMVFKFNASTGTKEIWVDGALAVGFSKSISAGYISNAGLTTLYLNSTVSYSKYFGAIDEIAVYTSNLPSALIYKHYLDFYNNSLPYSYQNNYVGAIPSAPIDTAGIDITEYAPGHPTPTVSALAQLQSAPMPRYMPLNTLKKNFNWVEPGYFGSYFQTGVSYAQAVTNSINLQKEMVFNFNYSWIVMSNTGSYINLSSPSTFESNWISLANQYPQYPASCISYWAQLRPSHAGYYSTSSYITSQNNPANHYLRNSAGQFINPDGLVSGTKYWAPSAPTDSIVKDGLTQKFYIQQLLNKLTRPLNFIDEDGEVLPQVDTTVLKMDPAVVADKTSSGLDWMTYYGNRCKNVTQIYKNQFMNGLAGLSNTVFTHYGIDGNPTYYRPKYSEYRQATTQMNGQYYPTSDFYPRWPSNWLTGVSAWRGWQWIVDSRYNEINLGDNLYSPFVSPGWSLNEEENIRPAQWLGLLKILGVTGAEFYYTGFFNEASSYNPPNPPPANPANYAWQVLMPSYAQAITSRYESLLRNSSLLNGDKTNNYQGGVLPGYSYNAGDVRFLVSARKHTTLNKYVISGTIQPNSNMIGNAELEKDAAITLATGVPLQFKIRRQGSVYIYDATIPSSPVFYQIDGWHENKHPYFWSKDFALEAELYDNSTNINGLIKTSVPSGTAAGDYRVYTSYLAWDDTVTNFIPLQYNFQPRVNNQNYFLWVRAKSKNGISTGVLAQLDANTAKTISCITDTAWNWYRYDICQQQISKFAGVTNSNHLLKITAMNSSVQLDKILLTLDSTLVLNAAVPSCSLNSAVINASGPLSFCTGDSVILSTATGTNYLWSTGATTQSIKVTTSGNYLVTVNYVSGCAAVSAPTTVSVTPGLLAQITAGSATTFCDGNSVVLTANSGATNYLWSNGATTQSITVTTSGSYLVTVYSPGGCSSVSSPVSVTVNPIPNNGVSISGPLTFCSGGDVILTTQPGYNYLWSNGETLNSISVNTSGNYSCLITSGSGCSIQTSITTVVVNPLPDTSIISNGPLNFCEGSNVSLTAANNSNYLWSNGSTNSSIVASTSGTYSVTVTNSFGCSLVSLPQLVTVASNPDTVMLVNGLTSFCDGGNVTLSMLPGYYYLWSNGATTNSIVASLSGSYSCQLTSFQGCTSQSSSINVTVNPNATTNISASGPLAFCSGGSVVLTADSSTNYLWSDGQTTQSISVNASGFYSVIETNSFGCSAVSVVDTVEVNQVPSNIISVLSGSLNFCSGDSAVLQAASGFNYLWSDGSTQQFITVLSSGNYSAIISSGNGCSVQSNSINISVANSPSNSISANGPLAFCLGGSVTLSADSTASSYLWSNGQTTQSILIQTSGIYLVTVTASSGCSVISNQANVTVSQNPVANIYPNGNQSICAGDSVILSADPGASYLWSNGSSEQSIVVNTTGNYFLSVTIAGGCTSYSDTINVQVNQLPVSIISTTGNLNLCQGDNVLLTSNSNYSYQWNTTETTQEIYVSTSGVYNVIVSDVNGCTSKSADVIVTVNPLPVAHITAASSLTFCEGSNVVLNSDSAVAYFWSDGQTTSSVTISQSGNYSVLIIDSNGCSAVSNALLVDVLSAPNAAVSISGNLTFCQGDSVIITADSSLFYYWSNSQTTQIVSITSSGNYYVIVANNDGCTAQSEIVNVNVIATPNVTVTTSGPTAFCQGDSVILTASDAVSYLWSNGETVQSITVTDSNLYNVFITDSAGCSALSSNISVQVYPLPVAFISANGPQTFCEGNVVDLNSDSASFYLWNNGAFTPSIQVGVSGNYNVIITDANGCTAQSNSIQITVNPNPVVSIAASGPLSFCEGNQVILSNDSSGIYLWSTGDTTQSISVNGTGVYYLTLTDNNGCSSVSDSVVVQVNQNPVVTIFANGPLNFCNGNNVVLTADSSDNYLWSNGDTIQQISVSISGTYYVVASNVSGCTSQSNNLLVTVNDNPTANISLSGPASFCEGDTLTLTCDSAATYLWNNGATTQSVSVTAGGPYFVEVNNAANCTAQSTQVDVVVYSNPSKIIYASDTTAFCNGDSVILSCGFAASYLWSNGATEQSITVKNSGAYSATVTNAGGCSILTDTVIVNVFASPSPNISANGLTTFCDGGSVTLTSDTAATYQWSNGSTDQNITVTTSGSYNVTITNAGGCSATSTAILVDVISNPTANISANGSTTFCDGGSVTLTSDTAATYLWSNGSTDQNITVTTSGSYNVTITNAGGCSATSTAIVVDVISNPTANISANGLTTFCDGGSVTLTSDTAATYQWSNGSTDQNITVTTSGSYNVTITNAGGCSAISTAILVDVISNPVANISANGLTTFCDGGSVTLTSDTAATYLWSNGSTDQNITVTTSGSYNVTIANAGGCSAISTAILVDVISNPTANISANGSTTFCDGGSVTLTSDTAATYLWSNGSTDQNITVTTSGSYNVTITNAGGCSAISTAILVDVISNPVANISANGLTTFCDGGSVTLTSDTAATYQWSNGSTDQNITVTTSGSYNVTITNAGGCSATSTAILVDVISNPVANISANGLTTFCDGGSVTLTSDTAATYQWSNGATDQNITVTTSGSYNVTITNAGGCSAISTAIVVDVIANPTANISANGLTTFCDGGSVTLTSDTAATYQWSNGATDQNITVTTSGSYNVTITNAGGCSATSTSIVVDVIANPVANISANGLITFCDGGSVTLTSDTAATYQWSNGSTDQNITVTTSGSYNVTITNAGGCSATSTAILVDVISNPTANISANGSTTFCDGGSVTLTSDTAATYLWSNGSTDQNITVTTSGSYNVTITNAGGCSATSTAIVVDVISNPTANISANGLTTFCDGGSVTLTSDTAATYQWSNGSTDQNITVITSGSYNVTITNAGGCSATSTAIVVDVISNPTANISANGLITFCDGGSVTLSADNGAISYLWSDGETTQNIVVNTSGQYSVTIVFGNGCSATSSVVQTFVNQLPFATITPNGNTDFCDGYSVDLIAGGGLNFIWSDGSTNAIISVNQSAIISVNVTDSNGCSANSSPIQINVFALPQPIISANGSLVFCEGGNVVLNVSSQSSYLWSTGETTQSITVDSSLSTFVLVVDSNGCTNNSAPVIVTENPLPIVFTSPQGDINICSGDSVLIVASTGVSYLWSNGNTDNEIYINATGNYDVIISDNNGCSSITSPVNLNVLPLPNATITNSGSGTLCAGDSIILTSSIATTYNWSTGFTTQSITVSDSGNYYVQIADSNGCSSQSAITPIVKITDSIPVIIANGPLTFCDGSSVTLSIQNLATAYLWSTGETTNSITVQSSGNYSVDVVFNSGCTGISLPVLVNVLPNPQVTLIANGPVVFCDGNTVELAADSGLTAYLWNTGSTESSLVVDTSGSYSLMVSDQNGCTSNSNTINVTVNQLPSATISADGPLVFCLGNQVQLTVDSAQSYLWSNGEITHSVLVDSSGSFNVTVTDINGCVNQSVIVSTIVNPLPDATITASGTTNFCVGASVTFNSLPGLNYLWSTGETTQSIAVDTTGLFNVIVTDLNNCSSTSVMQNVIVNPAPVASIFASDTTTFCFGDTVQLTADAGSTFFWSDGSTEQSLIVSTSGNYNCIATFSEGCTAITNTIIVDVLPLPNNQITASGPLTFCPGDSVILTADTAAYYTWTNGFYEQQLTIYQTGAYSVYITASNGCAAMSDTLQIVTLPQPQASISSNGPINFCDGGNVELTANPATSYYWSTGEITQNILVTQTGIYNVIVSNASGCTSKSASLFIDVGQNPTTNITPSGPTVFCEGTTLTLTADSGYTYNWSTGETTQSITVDSSANYFVVLNINTGCAAQSSDISVTMIPYHQPLISSNDSAVFCAGGFIELTADSGFSYLWNNGSTGQMVIADTSGSYIVTSVDTNGCSGTSAAFVVTVLPLPSAALSLTGNGFICSGDSLLITVDSSNSYVWSTGETTQSIFVSQSGSYNVLVTDSNNCSSQSASQQVTVLNLPDSNVTTSGPLVFCQGDSVVLTAAIADSYLWTTGESTQSIVVTLSGNYHVLLSNSNCNIQSTDYSITVNPLPIAVITANGSSSFCSGGSVILDAGFADTYYWSNGSTSQTILADSSGVYNVTITDVNGCSAKSADFLVTEFPIAIASISPSGTIQICQGTSTTINAALATNYLWSTGETDQSIDVSSSGTYQLTITDGNGCVSSPDSVEVIANTVAQATITALGDTSFCDGGNVLLNSSSGNLYLWSDGSTKSSLQVSSSGNYSVMVTDSNGCTSNSAPQLVTVFSIPDSALTITGDTLGCNGSISVLFDAIPGNTYLWSDGSTNQSLLATDSGSYFLTITSANGCISHSTPVNVIGNMNVEVTASGPLDLYAGQTVTLTATGANSYLWLPGNETTDSITVQASGTYYALGYNSSGCIDTSNQLNVIAHNLVPGNITSSGSNMLCPGDTLVLTASLGNHYLWSTGATTQTIRVSSSAIYSVTISDLNYTQSEFASINVTVTSLPSSPVITSAYNFGLYTFTAFSSSAGSYLWSTGETTTAIQVNAVGTYNVYAISPYNCVSLKSTSLSVNSVLPKKCSVARLLSTYDIIDTSAVISWDPSLRADSFIVTYNLVGSIQLNHIMLIGSSNTTKLSGLIPNSLYEWNVTSVCPSAGIYITSSSTYFRTKKTEPLPCGNTPYNLFASGIDTASAFLNWYITLADSFEIRFRKVSDLSWSYHHVSGYPVNNYFIQGLKPTTFYEWNIRAYCGNLVTSYSPLSLFKTADSPTSCPVPTGFWINEVGSFSAKLHWDTTFVCDSMQVRFNVVGSSVYQFRRFPSNPNPGVYILNGLVKGTYYEIALKSRCAANGNSPLSPTLIFRTKGIAQGTARNDENDNSDLITELNLYPVPVHDQLNIEFFSKAEIPFSLKVINILGECVLNQTDQAYSGYNEKELAVGNLPSGIYILSIEIAGSETKRVKFTVN